MLPIAVQQPIMLDIFCEIVDFLNAYLGVISGNFAILDHEKEPTII